MDDFRVVLLIGGPPLDYFQSIFLEKIMQDDEIHLVGIIAQRRGRFRGLWKLLRQRKSYALVIILEYLKRVLFRGKEISRGEKPKDLRYFQGKYGLPILYTLGINEDRVVETVRKMRPTLGVIYGTGLVKPEILDLPEKGMIGIHHGKVPDYRGPSTTAFWPLYNDEKETGITIQQVNKGIDTGGIILRRTFPIEGGDDIYSLREKAGHLGVEALLEAISMVKCGNVNPVPQESKGKLYTFPTFGQWINLRLKMRKRRRPR